MANISVICINGQDYNVKDFEARQGINNLTNSFNSALLQPLYEESITAKQGYYDYTGFHSGNYEAAEYNCTPGEKIFVTCSGNSAFAGYYIYDSNWVRILSGTLDKVFNDFEVVVPDHGVKIGLNLLGGSDGRVNALYIKKQSTDNPHYIDEVNKKLASYLLQPMQEKSITAKQGYYDYTGFHSGNFEAAEYTCTPGEKIFVTCSGNSAFAGYYIYDSNWVRILSGTLDKVFNTFEVVVPDHGVKIGLNSLNGTEGRAYILSVKKVGTNDPYYINELTERIDYWKEKSILWLGTSIPEGGANINGKWNTYPGIIADEIGATVYNRAKGSSMMRAGDHTRVTENDPFGWTGRHYSLPAYSLSMTVAEKQAFIDNFDYWKTQITGAPSSLSDNEKAAILSCSYENRLLPYLSTGEHPVDMFVFDHGYNDAFNNPTAAKEDVDDMLAEPSNPTDRTYFLGALRYLINVILNDNPKAKIVFIGHYESDRYTAVYKAQEKAHEIWGYPLFRTWEFMGFSQNQINGSTITHIWCPDDIHPHSGGAETLVHYANVVLPFIRDMRK